MVKNSFIHGGSLYLVLSEQYGRGRPALDLARSAVAGGIDILQMREKNKSRRELLRLGRSLSHLCKENQVLFIVNDDPFLARRLRADGVHLGQEDMVRFPMKDVRRMLGSGKIIGVSTHSVAQFQKANVSDVDYIAFGPIYPTKTKSYHIGAEDVPYVLATSLKPVVLIGGIQMSHIDGLLKQGATNVAMIRDIIEAPDVELQVRECKRLLTAAPWADREEGNA